MKLIAYKPITELNHFEYEVAKSLVSINIDGYALISPKIDSNGVREVDFIVFLKKGCIICLEAKGRDGKWTGSLNEEWYAGNELIKSSHGNNPGDQCQEYCLAVKKQLERFISSSNLFVIPLIVAPNVADFSGIESENLHINHIGWGKKINLAHVGKIESVFNSVESNQSLAKIFSDDSKIITIICQLTNIKKDIFLTRQIRNLEELQKRRNASRTIVEEETEDKSENIPLTSEEKQEEAQDVIEFNPNTDLKPTDKKPKGLIVAATILLPLIALSTVGLFVKRSIPKIKSTITIGGLSKENNIAAYQELGKHLDNSIKELKVEMIAENEPSSYLRAIQKIKNKQWSVVFAYSPIISVEAEKNGYKPIATMFPGEPGYTSAIFVKSNSKIREIRDINRNHTILLKNFYSASGFYFPIYELANDGNIEVNVEFAESSKILEEVEKGNIDIGVAPLEEVKDNFHVLAVSRYIPGSQVYASPDLSEKDRNILKDILLNAPSQIQKNAKYGQIVSPQNYSEFARIIDKVQGILACDNFSQNPVKIGCDRGLTKKTLEGNITSIQPENNQVIYVVQDKKSGEVCKVSIPKRILKEVEPDKSYLELRGSVTFYIAVDSESSNCKPNSVYPIYQAPQLLFHGKD